jgi:hypothetical protein
MEYAKRLNIYLCSSEEEQQTSNLLVAGSIPARGALRVLHNGSASAFQADSASSILVTRSQNLQMI